MKYIIGQNRKQVEFVTQSLDESIDKDNEVRLIDAFVDSLKLEELGFEMDYDQENDETSLRRCGINLYSLQPAKNHEYHWNRSI